MMWLKTGTIPNKEEKKKIKRREKGRLAVRKEGWIQEGTALQMSMKSGSQLILQCPAAKFDGLFANWIPQIHYPLGFHIKSVPHPMPHPKMTPQSIIFLQSSV